jgi:hypothetical protein
MTIDDQGIRTQDARQIKHLADRDQAYASYVRKLWRQRHKAAEQQTHNMTRRLLSR